MLFGNKFKHIRMYLHRKAPLAVSAYTAYRGRKLLDFYRKGYDQDIHIFLVRGATGDAYFQLSILDNWAEENGVFSYLIVGDVSGLDSVRRIFPMKECRVLSSYDAGCIQRAYMLYGGEKLNLSPMFLWDHGLYFNRCRVRMIDRFHFMDTYRWYVVDLKGKMKMLKPQFIKKDEQFYKEMEKKGVLKGKTVIVAPDANSVTGLPVCFWRSVIQELKRKGYIVFVNSMIRSEYEAQDIFFSYEESVPLLEYAGYFIGVRSGLCDIVSTAACKKIILYPKKGERVNYSEHRSEIQFSGFAVMGLCDEEDRNMIEISTPLLRNITQEEPNIKDMDEYYYHLKKLKKLILKSTGNILEKKDREAGRTKNYVSFADSSTRDTMGREEIDHVFEQQM